MSPDLPASSIFWIITISILLMVALALVVVVYANWARNRILSDRVQKKDMELKHQEELVQRNIIVQEEERQRIAANLHDDIGSKLGVMHLSFHRLRKAMPGTPEYEQMYKEIDGLIVKTLDTARKISHELMPPTLEDFGLIEALKELRDQVNKTGALNLNLEHTLTRAEIGDPETELNLFRIAQELCNNTLKYAQASEINLILIKNEQEKRVLLYSDDGQGFEVNAPENIGLGLKNLNSRCRIIGATIQINSAPGHGFQARVEW